MEKNKKSKKGLFVFLMVFIIVCLFAGWFFLIRKTDPIINDATIKTNNDTQETSQEDNDNQEGSDEPRDEKIVLSSLVKTYINEDAQNINDQIIAYRVTNEAFYIDINKGTKFDELGAGDVFYLEGSESTALNETVIGKVSRIVDNGTFNTFRIVSPSIDEAFDEIYLNRTEILTEENIVGIETVEGVTYEFVDSIDSIGELSATDNQEVIDNLVYKEEKKKDKDDSASIKFSLNAEFDIDYADSNGKDKEDSNAGKLKIGGEIGLEKIKVSTIFDFNILKITEGNPIRNLGVNATANIVASASVDFAMKGEKGGEATEIAIPFTDVKLQGLDEKKFPIAMIYFNSGSIAFTGGKTMDEVLNVRPITIGVIVYADASGNISFECSKKITFKKSLEFTYEAIKNGEFINDIHVDEGDSVASITENYKLSGEIDTCLGVSADLFICDLNLLDIGFISIGGELNGDVDIKLSGKYANEKFTDGDSQIKGELYARFYLKLVDINFKLKMKYGDNSDEIKYSFLFKDLTIKELNAEMKTKLFSKSYGSFNRITASDDNYYYYMDEYGQLTREDKNKNKLPIYNKKFYKICGMDYENLYLLVSSDSNFDLVQVKKNGSGNDVIASNIVSVLLYEDNNFYCIKGDADNTVYKINTEKEESVFITADDEVIFLNKQNDNYYLVTTDGVSLGFLLSPTNHYYLYTENGNIAQSYGTGNDIENYFYDYEDNYTTARRIVGTSEILTTVSDYYLGTVAGDNLYKLETERYFNNIDSGVLTLRSEDDDTYMMVLNHPTGGTTDVVKINDKCAILTITKGNDGFYYYFDTDGEKINLYRLSSDFSNKTQVRTLSNSDMPYSLENCRVEILNNRIYFYSVVDNYDITVFYRCDLYD